MTGSEKVGAHNEVNWTTWSDYNLVYRTSYQV